MTRTATQVIAGTIDGIPPGEGRAFAVGSERIAIFHTRAGRVFAVQAVCPHLGGPLADGLVGGTTLICPLHSWKFDLSTGAALMGECGLQTYPVSLDESGQILLTLAGDTHD